MEKQEMVKVIKDQKKIKLFENPNYFRILSILRNGGLRIKEIHKRFNEDYEDKKTLTSIYRYMEKLVCYGLVFVSKEEMCRGHLIESYYSRTARIFFLEDERGEEDVVNAATELLQQICSLNKKDSEGLEKLLSEWEKDLHKHKMDFYSRYGEEILGVEKKYGSKAVQGATYIVYLLLYFKNHPELPEALLKILER